MHGDFQVRTVTVASGTHRYAIYLPQPHPSDLVGLPVVTYLHGRGNGGRDGLRPTHRGLGAAIRAYDAPAPFVGVFPQSPEDTEFVGPVADLVRAATADAIDALGLHRSARYLVGSSMGGHGAYHLVQRDPTGVAGLVISCSSPFRPAWRLDQLGLPPEDRASGLRTLTHQLRHVPTWIFHGAQDEIVPVTEARAVVDALNGVGAPVRYTEYPDGGHELCSRPYQTPALWDEVFTHPRTPDRD